MENKKLNSIYVNKFPVLKNYHRVCRSKNIFVLVKPPEHSIILDKLSALILFLCDGTRSVSELQEALSEMSNGRVLIDDVLNLLSRHKTDVKYCDVRSKFSPNNNAEFDHLFCLFNYSPIALTVIPTEACNLSCNYCIREQFSKNQKWKNETFEKLICEASELSIAKINIGGGEPLLVPSIHNFMSPITQNDGHFFQQVDGSWLIELTNGALPRTPRFFKAWGQQIVGSATGGKRKGSPKAPLSFDDYSPPIRLSLDGLLLSRARLRFTEPLRIH